MSKRYNNGSHYENHQKAAEMHELAAHSHGVAEQHGLGEHLSGEEHTRKAMEHSETAHRLTQQTTVGHGIAAFGHHEIEALAYELWEKRGRPAGSGDEDWRQAVEQLRAHSHSA